MLSLLRQQLCGRLAQLGEHLPYKQRVIGSSPIAPTTLFFKLGRLAQLGEHLPYKQRVIGSSPIAPTRFTVR